MAARVLAEVQQLYGNDYIAFAAARSQAAQQQLLGHAWDVAQEERYCLMAQQSLERQREIEAGDTLPFEEWRLRYMASEQCAV